MITVCLFDIDGTLINTRGAGTAALHQAMQTAFAVQGPAANVEIHGRTDRAIVRDLFLAHGIDDSMANWQKFRSSYLRHLPRMLAAKKGTILPGILELLELLASRDDAEVGLLTGNARRGAELKLQHFGIEHFFEFGGFGDRHLERDEVARDAFMQLQRRFGSDIDAGRVWVIGDTPLDVQCAKAIGARSLAVATGQHTADQLRASRPDHVAANLAEIDALALICQ
jgi:phosphoglycolate phosphatase-like HAD superfamily hydrolase